MPSTVTHSLFALDVLSHVEKDYKNLYYNIEYLKLFSQGADPLNFYSIDNIFDKKIVRRKYPKLLHTKKTKKLFICLIKNIIDNKLYYDEYVMSYLYGLMCHYFLDSTIHPYIIYYSGNYNNRIKNTYKYNGLHSLMEVNIDLYMINKVIKVEPTKFKLHKYCFNIEKFNNNLNNLLDICYKEVYGIDNFSKIYYKSIIDMKRVNRIFRYDRYGIKKKLYKFIDFITPDSFTNMSALSYHDKINEDYLNKDHETWNHIQDKNEVCNYSFDDLYNIALNNCVSSIKKVYDIIYNNGNINELNNIFLNLSYLTGKNCNDKRKIRYFKF